jgi:GDP-mannose pyrophosphatase NudK
MEPNQVNITETEILSDNWYTLMKITYEYTRGDNPSQTISREVYDRGNGATILLYNLEQGTVILTRQFRLPTFVNGNETGFLIETCAGLLEKENPEEAIRRETEEETGYKIGNIQKVFEAYMSPGSVTEILYFFIAEYTKDMKVNEGGGARDENENIEVLELDIEQAMHMIRTGEIRDGKTIMLLQHVMLNQVFPPAN